jgi:two-component system, cell cycle response regulator DivK
MAGVPSERVRALVIEDDPHVAQLLREILTGHGHDVAQVEDGALAASAVRALRPDVVVLDLGLPAVHGFDVLDDIKGDPDVAHIPVVVVTAWYTPNLEGRARAIGAAAVIGKPFDVRRITESVDAALAGEPAPIVNH